MSEPDVPQPVVQNDQQAQSEVNQQPEPADAAPVTTPQPPQNPADGSETVPAQPAEPAGATSDGSGQNGSGTNAQAVPDPAADWDEATIRFTGTAYLIAQRDGISPEEAAINLANLLGSEDVIAKANAEKAAQEQAAAEKEAAVNQKVSEITAKINELQSLLGQ